MAARIKVLEDTPGAPGIYKSMKKDCRIEVIRHAWLQLEVAGLEKRRSGQVTLELDRGEGRWKPVVVIAGETDDPIYTECLWMTMSYEATKYLASSGKESTVIDYRRQSAAVYIPEGARLGEGTIYIPAFISPRVRMIGFKITPGVSSEPPSKEEGY